MPPSIRQALNPSQRAGYATNKPAPPQPLPYKPAQASERISRHPPEPIQPAKPLKQTLIRRLFSLRDEAPVTREPKNIARGIAATQRVLTEGVLDPRYRPAARRVTAIICALPIVFCLGYELFQRRFEGKEQKAIPEKKSDIMEEKT